MFEFYRLVTDPDTKNEKIEKVQYEDTKENLSLKEKLEKEIKNYECYETVIYDRYYHCNICERTYSPSLSWSVFKDDKLVAYMIDGAFYVVSGSNVELSNEVRGATSFNSYVGIRKK